MSSYGGRDWGLTGWDFYEGDKSNFLRQGALPLSVEDRVERINPNIDSVNTNIVIDIG